MSILFPTGYKVADRKYAEAAVRGRYESNLRVNRGRVNTTTPTILDGVGFTAVRNGTGLVTLTFDPPFSAAATVIAIAELPTGDAFMYVRSTSATTAQLQRVDAAGAGLDGIFAFLAVGPT